jgi:hypothetical protein
VFDRRPQPELSVYDVAVATCPSRRGCFDVFGVQPALLSRGSGIARVARVRAGALG